MTFAVINVSDTEAQLLHDGRFVAIIQRSPEGDGKPSDNHPSLAYYIRGVDVAPDDPEAMPWASVFESRIVGTERTKLKAWDWEKVGATPTGPDVWQIRHPLECAGCGKIMSNVNAASKPLCVECHDLIWDEA